jgi:ADP-heptose:LPS heptosyltransferase
VSAKIALLKFIDRVIGGVMVRLLPRPSHRPHGVPRTFLLIRPGGIGDAVHLLPLLQRLQEHFPTAHISLLAERRNAGIFDLSPVKVTVWCYDRPLEFLRALFGRYDVVIDSEQWHRLSAIVARLVRAPLKIGFASNARQRLFTDPLPYSQTTYEAEVFLSLLTPLAIASAPLSAPPWLLIPQKIEADSALLRTRINGRYVVVFPGASIATRRWGEKRFRLLARAISESGWQVVVVGGRDDCATAKAICRDGSGHDFAGKTSLAETSALIAGADLLVSGDSGLLHIGVALGIPTVSLFGPGISEKWAPRGEQHSVLNLQLPCSPCTLFGTTPPCKKEQACLSGISVDAVMNAVKKQLQQNGIA